MNLRDVCSRQLITNYILDQTPASKALQRVFDAHRHAPPPVKTGLYAGETDNSDTPAVVAHSSPPHTASSAEMDVDLSSPINPVPGSEILSHPRAASTLQPPAESSGSFDKMDIDQRSESPSGPDIPPSPESPDYSAGLEFTAPRLGPVPGPDIDMTVTHGAATSTPSSDHTGLDIEMDSRDVVDETSQIPDYSLPDVEMVGTSGPGPLLDNSPPVVGESINDRTPSPVPSEDSNAPYAGHNLRKRKRDDNSYEVNSITGHKCDEVCTHTLFVLKNEN